MQQRRAAQEKGQLSPRSREVLARESKGYIDSATLPHSLQGYGPLSSTHQGILYAPPPGQVPTSTPSERSGARTTSPMPPRDTTPPRAAEERSSSVGSPWPPQHHMHPRPGHPQHSPGGMHGSRPGEHPRHPTPPPGGVIRRSITQGSVIMEPRVNEPGHLNNSPFATLVDVAAKQQHVSVPGKDRHPQLSPAPRGEPPKDGRQEQMSKVTVERINIK